MSNRNLFVTTKSMTNATTVSIYKWQMKYYKKSNMTYNHETAPCAFHRLMQRLFFGFYWNKIE